MSDSNCSDMNIGLFFENWTHYTSIIPSLLFYVKRDRSKIERLADLLYDSSKAIYWGGFGRSEKVALRGNRNFEEGLCRTSSYVTGDGFDTKPDKEDIFITVSGSLDDKNKDRFEIAKKHGMKTVSITKNPESRIAKESDIVITMPGKIAGEPYIKDYFKKLSVNEFGPRQPTPFEELGAVFELGSFFFIDALSYACSKHEKLFPFNLMEKKLYNSMIYLGECGQVLDQQVDKICKLVKSIQAGSGNVYTSGFRYNAEIAAISAIRLHHEVYVKDRRKAFSIESKNFPKFKKGDILMPITGEGENIFINYVVDECMKSCGEIFPITYKPDSSVVSKAGIDNSIIMPKGKHYEMKDGYEIRDFEIGVLPLNDCISLSLGRTEEEMRKTHSAFS